VDEKIFARAALAPKLTGIVKISQKASEIKDFISFTVGLPAPEAVPVAQLRQIVHELVEEYGAELWKYTPPRGSIQSTLVEFLKEDNINVHEDNILITSGALEAGNIITRAFINPGDTIIIEAPVYPINLQNFLMQTDNIITCPVDEEGINVDELRKLLKRFRPKFVYVVPDFQNPTGVTLSLERRKELVKLAFEFDFLIFEDTPYRYMRYTGDRLPSLFELAPERVLHVNSFSKILATGLRVGYLVAKQEYITRFITIKQATTYCTPIFNQLIVTKFLEKGLWQTQLERLKTVHLRKLEIFLDALKEHMPEEVNWNIPNGGTFIWLRLPQQIDMKDLLNRALKYGTAFIPSTDFYPPNAKNIQKAMRLNFPHHKDERIREGINRLANAIKDTLLG